MYLVFLHWDGSSMRAKIFVWLLMYFKGLEQDLAIGTTKRFVGWICHRFLLRLHMLTNLISPIPTGRFYCYYYYYYYHYYFFLKMRKLKHIEVKPLGQDHTRGSWSRKHSGPRSPDFRDGAVSRPSLPLPHHKAAWPPLCRQGSKFWFLLGLPVLVSTKIITVTSHNVVKETEQGLLTGPRPKRLLTQLELRKSGSQFGGLSGCIQNWFLRSEWLFGQYFSIPTQSITKKK